MSPVILSVFFFVLIQIEKVNGQKLYPTSNGYVGAVYTMSNGVNVNEIFIHTLNSNGQLSMISSMNSSGIGVNTTNADPLFSQGSLIVYSNYLFAVNPGSNSLSMFMINPSDARKLTLLSTQSTNGLFPISITVNSMYVCVLTGGSLTGIRCFTYNSSGLYLVSSFDRNLTSYISQSIPPSAPPNTMSQIQFSADDRSLIISIKGTNRTIPGYLLFYLLTNNKTMLSLNPTQVTPTSAVFPFSMTLVENNALLITDPGAPGVLTMTYSSSNGLINNSMYTFINASLAGALCWSTYSPIIGNYYVIGASTATIVELNINISSISNPVQIIQYYQLPNNTGALEATVVSLAGQDFLYIIGTIAHVITGYRLNAAGNATSNTLVTVQQGNTTNIPKLAGIAAFVHTQSSLATSISTSIIIITISIIFTFVPY